MRTQRKLEDDLNCLTPKIHVESDLQRGVPIEFEHRPQP